MSSILSLTLSETGPSGDHLFPCHGVVSQRVLDLAKSGTEI